MEEEDLKKAFAFILAYIEDLKEITWDRSIKETFNANGTGWKEFQPGDFYEIKFKFRKG